MDSLNINTLKHFLRIFLSVPACSDRYKANPVETNSSRKGKNENFQFQFSIAYSIVSYESEPFILTN